ncbi:dTDP-4-dehydrorhamnose reductase [bacterium]|nr:dTDP-4-dehydrorhamnose reductase [bacterium]
MRVLITGARGMLGTELLLRRPPGWTVIGVDIEDGDLTDAAAALRLMSAHEPQVVIHCAAWADVDGCTRDPARAMLLNAGATANVTAACRRVGARLITLSTDYVFAGDLDRAYVEDDTPRPLNPYGESKLAGERAAAALPDHLIVRTQWLYGPAGKNFVATIVRAARTHDKLRVVADEWGSPTYTRDLAEGLWRLAPTATTGIVHLTNSGVCSWHDLAVRATRLAGIAVEIEPISSSEWNSPTVRPHYSPLDNRRWRELGWEPLRPWTEAVEEFVREHLAEAPPPHEESAQP